MRKYRQVICKDCKKEARHHALEMCRRCYYRSRAEYERKCNKFYYQRKKEMKNAHRVTDSLMGEGLAIGKPFVVDGEEMVMVKFSNKPIEWKVSELSYQ